MRQQANNLSPQFIAKKQSILSQLALDPKDYEDKSPKGSVDIQILDLLRLINDVDGWVTTSSCAGRVAVFVEGPKKAVPGQGSTSTDLDDPSGGGRSDSSIQEDSTPAQAADDHDDTATKTAAPGGKGGGHWLYVSHDPLPTPPSSTTTHPSEQHWTQTFHLSRPHNAIDTSSPRRRQRLVHLTFSPLILHVLCASLQHARPLLAASINAGFRESGVQSLKALEEGYAGEGVMVAVRTNGIVFETIVGVWDGDGDGDGYEEGGEGEAVAVVGEEYLRLCVGVVNERFGWNEERKRRLVGELRKVVGREGWGEMGETKEERRERKKREGLERQYARRREKEGLRSGDDAFADEREDFPLQDLANT